MPHTIASYLSEGRESLIIVALDLLIHTLPDEHPLRKDAEEYKAALENDIWLCETTLPPEEADSDE